VPGGTRDWAVEMATLLAETNKACHEARAAGKKRLGTRELAAFLSSYDAIVSAGLAVNPDPVGRKAELPREESYNIAIALRDRRSEATLFARDLSIPFTTTRPSPRSEWPSSTEKISAASRATTRPNTSRRSAPTSPPRGSTASALSTSSPGLLRRRLDATGDNLSTTHCSNQFRARSSSARIHRCVPYVRDLNFCMETHCLESMFSLVKPFVVYVVLRSSENGARPATRFGRLGYGQSTADQDALAFSSCVREALRLKQVALCRTV